MSQHERELNRIRHKRYVAANQEKVYTKSRNWLLAHPKQRMLNSARQRAKKKELEFTLVADDIIIPEYCPITGLRLVPGVGAQCDSSPSLDRVDDSQGYTPNNVRVISYKGNRWKSNMTREDLQRLYDYVFTGQTRI